MYTYQYPHPAVTTDCVIFGYDIREGLSKWMKTPKQVPEGN